MPSSARAPRSARTLPALLLLLAAVAVATAGVAFASVPAPAPAASPDVVGHGAVEPAIGRSVAVTEGRSFDYDRDLAIGSASVSRAGAATVAPAPASAAPEGTAWITRAETDTPEPRARAVAADAPEASGFSGRNRVWIPALGIKRSISFFSCSSSAYPGDRVYRWGCAGRNNVYLFGHAHSVFKPLHDAYVRGNLKKGMKVYYADGNGKVSTYKVIWWRVTTPDKGGFAYAGQSRPSMTLQTCVGAKSQYRLIVRLVKV